MSDNPDRVTVTFDSDALLHLARFLDAQKMIGPAQNLVWRGPVFDAARAVDRAAREYLEDDRARRRSTERVALPGLETEP